MSQPIFPEPNPHMTLDNSLNMILTSIAMDELALSHIMEAESEKILYVLGALGNKMAQKPSVEDIIAINDSVTRLLESVAENEYILKMKMEKALEYFCRPCPCPCPFPNPCPCPGPCPSPCPCPGPCPSPCPCPGPFPGPYPPPCPPPCRENYCAVYKCRKMLWHCGTRLPWSQENCLNCFINNERKIVLPPGGRYQVSFAVNADEYFKCGEQISLSLQLISEGNTADVFNYHAPVQNDGRFTITASGIVVDSPACGLNSIALKLHSPDILPVEQGMLSIIEI